MGVGTPPTEDSQTRSSFDALREKCLEKDLTAASNLTTSFWRPWNNPVAAMVFPFRKIHRTLALNLKGSGESPCPSATLVAPRRP